MPLLATFLFNVFAAFAAWLAKYLTQKIAVALALIAVVTALFAALYFGLRAAISAALVGAASLHPMFAAGVSVVISPHTSALITAYLTFWALVELYKWKVNIVQLWSRTI
jgi:hypothetical protein